MSYFAGSHVHTWDNTNKHRCTQQVVLQHVANVRGDSVEEGKKLASADQEPVINLEFGSVTSFPC